MACNPRGVDLPDAEFRGVDLGVMNLQRTERDRTDVTGAVFDAANMDEISVDTVNDWRERVVPRCRLQIVHRQERAARGSTVRLSSRAWSPSNSH